MAEKKKKERFEIKGYIPVRFKATISPDVLRWWRKQGEPPGLSEILEKQEELKLKKSKQGDAE